MWPFLTDEQQMAVDSMTRLCRDEIAPAIAPHANDVRFPADLLRAQLKRLVEYGIGNGRVPEADGGFGLDFVTSGLILEVATMHILPVAGPAFINESIALILSKLGTPAIKERYLAPLVAGERIAGSANTEPAGGSDVSAVATRARSVPGGYRLSGRKIWITNGPDSDFLTVLARTDDTGKLDLYLVDRAAHGYDVRPLETAGRVTTAEIAFDDVEIPEDHRLNTGSKGLGAMLASFQGARAYVGLNALASARVAFEMAVDYAKQRTQFGKPIGAMQAIQHQLADSAVEIDAARLLVYRALAMADRGQDAGIAASMAKLYATEAAQRIAARAVQIHGGYGLSSELPLERIARNAHVGTIVEGTSEIQRNIIGRALTGLSAF